MKIDYIHSDILEHAKNVLSSMSENEKFWFENAGDLHPFIFGDVVFDLYYNKGNALQEGLITTYPFEQVKASILKLLRLPEKVINVYADEQGAPEIAMIVPVSKKESAIKIFDLCGYYLAQEHDMHYIPELNSNTMMLLFHAKFKNNDIVDVKQWPVIYHITQTILYNKIMRTGLVPKAAVSNFKYPASIYCIKGDANFMQIKFLAKQLHDYKLEHSVNKYVGNEYTVLSIDTSMLSDNITFYGDPDFAGGVYTYDNIPPKAISKFISFDFS